MRAIFFLAMLCLSSQSWSVDMTVFGITLGESLSLPQCKDRSSVEEMCFEYEIFSKDLTIKFPPSECPDYIGGGGNLSIRLLEGRVEAIWFETTGEYSADTVLKVLTEKYGMPSKMIDNPKRNAYGVVYNSYIALWKFPTLQVRYSSILDKVTSGQVVIETDKILREEDVKNKDRVKKWRGL